MIDPKRFDDLARRITESLPESVRHVQEDVQRQVRSSLQSGFERMDLVTSEDFDIQVALLERTRERLAELEARVALLEAQASDKSES
ncbi:ubiquinone biosynthesis accessory factor UbiK [Thioalkalivibrio sp. ALJ7]|uniref:ubiquinone biosynthesis accessory factor UbiK n=1 Tax=Thioalkalivibrio sp. ALJ7 TaxID=1158756 RepID=UPI000364B413|nr:accessory factor UbiK family protein [Thioalkalivibrio sp. ALJ7]